MVSKMVSVPPQGTCSAKERQHSQSTCPCSIASHGRSEGDLREPAGHVLTRRESGGSGARDSSVSGSTDLVYHLSRSQQGYSESPDLEFEYADTDKWAAELSGKDGPWCCLGVFVPDWPLIKLRVNAILESAFPHS